MELNFKSHYNEALFEWLDELADRGVFTTDTHLNVISWNHWLERRTGLSSSQTIGHHLLELYPELSQKRLDRFYHQALNGQAAILSQRLYGYLLPMMPSVVQNRRDHMQQIVRIEPLISRSIVIGTITGIQDVTERMLRETQFQNKIRELECTNSALRTTQAQLKSLLSSSPTILYTGEAQTTSEMTFKFTFISDNTIERLGYQPDLFIDRENFYLDRVHPDDRELLFSQLTTLWNKGHQILEHRFLHADSYYRWLRHEIQLMTNCSHQKKQVVGAIYDISDRKNTEDKLEEQAALINLAKDAIMVKDLDNKILFWNPGSETLYGWKTHEILGKPVNETLWTPANFAKFQTAKQMTLKQGEWQGELDQIDKNGNEVIVSSRWTLVTDERNQPKSILTVNTDITEKKLLEAQFLRVQRMESIGTLASGIAHDLNNILSPILASVHLLRMNLPEVKQDQILMMLETNTIRGADLVKQVLSFAKGLEGERTIVQVRHLVEEIRSIAQETFPKTINIHTNVPRELWLVYADPTQIHQILMNLCVNARDAMPYGGHLSIVGTNVWIDEHYAKFHLDAKVGYYTCLQVKDTGIGISPDNLHKIFEPFFTTKEVTQGTGLGLSTVMGIVKSHGGFIQVLSQVDRGTEFKVYLPAAPENHAEIIPKPDFPKGQGELILLVDDEPVILEITQTVLETNNYRVLTAANGIEALAKYTEYVEQINVVLLNIIMPSMDGKTTLKYLQAMNPSLKVILVSGFPDYLEDDMALDPEVIRFLSKPYTSQDLLKILSKILHPVSTNRY